MITQNSDSLHAKLKREPIPSLNRTLRNWPIEKCIGLIAHYIEIAGGSEIARLESKVK